MTTAAPPRASLPTLAEPRPTPVEARRMGRWLFLVCGLIAAMVVVGGATRLTDSGLSITEWRPVTGAVPPLSEAGWRAEFAKYKEIPEYREVNYGMSLAQFKTIYWWEWGHRQLGRIVGAAFFFPFIYFLASGAATGRLALKLGGLFALGALQGAVGWWMVASGLAARIDVSQYRLAAHLGLAFALFGLTFWLALDLRARRTPGPATPLFWGAVGLTVLVFTQIVLGAFVAGLRAGATFNTWPLMDGAFVPAGYFAGAPGLNDLFETAAATQFNHRLGAYGLAAAAAAFWFAARRSALERRARAVAAIIVVQIALGVATVINAAPLGLALGHQATALILFTVAIWTAHGALRVNQSPGVSGSAASAAARARP